MLHQINNNLPKAAFDSLIRAKKMNRIWLVQPIILAVAGSVQVPIKKKATVFHTALVCIYGNPHILNDNYHGLM